MISTWQIPNLNLAKKPWLNLGQLCTTIKKNMELAWIKVLPENNDYTRGSSQEYPFLHKKKKHWFWWWKQLRVRFMCVSHTHIIRGSISRWHVELMLLLLRPPEEFTDKQWRHRSPEISAPNAESISNNMTRTKIQKEKTISKRFNEVRQLATSSG